MAGLGRFHCTTQPLPSVGGVGVWCACSLLVCVSVVMYEWVLHTDPISRGFKCKVCKTSVHVKCQNYIPYCSGVSQLALCVGQGQGAHVHPLYALSKQPNHCKVVQLFSAATSFKRLGQVHSL